jgi:hypothetical protein
VVNCSATEKLLCDKCFARSFYPCKHDTRSKEAQAIGFFTYGLRWAFQCFEGISLVLTQQGEGGYSYSAPIGVVSRKVLPAAK